MSRQYLQATRKGCQAQLLDNAQRSKLVSKETGHILHAAWTLIIEFPGKEAALICTTRVEP
jgi:hypothetical protein